MHLTDLGTPAASGRPEPLFPAVAFVTPWRRLQRLSLPPATSCAVPAACPDSEHGLLLLAGQVEVQTRAPDAALTAVLGPAPAWLVGQLGSEFLATSRGPNAALLVHLEVAAGAQRRRSAAVGSFAAAALAWRPAIHGGRGQVATRHVLPPSRFASALTFLDHARLGPDSSLGLHYHDALEESFVVLGGHGYLTAGTHTRAVGPGAGAACSPSAAAAAAREAVRSLRASRTRNAV